MASPSRPPTKLPPLHEGTPPTPPEPSPSPGLFIPASPHVGESGGAAGVSPPRRSRSSGGGSGAELRRSGDGLLAPSPLGRRGRRGSTASSRASSRDSRGSLCSHASQLSTSHPIPLNRRAQAAATHAAARDMGDHRGSTASVSLEASLLRGSLSCSARDAAALRDRGHTGALLRSVASPVQRPAPPRCGGVREHARRSPAAAPAALDFSGLAVPGAGASPRGRSLSMMVSSPRGNRLSAAAAAASARSHDSPRRSVAQLLEASQTTRGSGVQLQPPSPGGGAPPASPAGGAPLTKSPSTVSLQAVTKMTTRALRRHLQSHEKKESDLTSGMLSPPSGGSPLALRAGSFMIAPRESTGEGGEVRSPLVFSPPMSSATPPPGGGAYLLAPGGAAAGPAGPPSSSANLSFGDRTQTSTDKMADLLHMLGRADEYLISRMRETSSPNDVSDEVKALSYLGAGETYEAATPALVAANTGEWDAPGSPRGGGDARASHDAELDILAQSAAALAALASPYDPTFEPAPDGEDAVEALIPHEKLALQYTSLWGVPGDHCLRARVHALTRSRLFDAAVVLVILLNSLHLSIEPFEEAAPWLEHVFVALFTVEALLKIYADGFVMHPGAYLTSGWNRLDFFIVLAAWLGYIPGVANFTGIRLVRAIRPLRYINGVRGLKAIVGALFLSVQGLLHVLLLIAFYFTVFGILGVQLFSGMMTRRCVDPATGVPPGHPLEEGQFCANASHILLGRPCPPGLECRDHENPDYGFSSFDNLVWAALLIFQCITLEGWTTQMYRVQDLGGWVAFAYFFPLVIFGAFFIFNLALAVISERFHWTKEIQQTLAFREKMALLLQEEMARQQREEDPSPYELEQQAATAALLGRPVPTRTSAPLVRKSPSGARSAEMEPTTTTTCPIAALALHGKKPSHKRSLPPLLLPPPIEMGRRVSSVATSGGGDAAGGDDPQRGASSSPVVVTLERPVSLPAAAAAAPLEGKPPPADSPASAATEPQHLLTADGSAAVVVPLSGAAAAKPRGQSRPRSPEDLLGAARAPSANGGMKHRPSVIAPMADDPAVSSGGDPPRSSSLASSRTSFRRVSTNLSRASVSFVAREGEGDGQDDGAAAAAGPLPAPAPRRRASHEDAPPLTWVQELRASSKEVTDGKPFQYFIIGCISVNTILLATEHEGQSYQLSNAQFFSNLVLAGVFAAEFGVKLFSVGLRGYLSDNFNILDGLIVLVSLAELFQDDQASGVSIFRALRLLRVFKLMKSFQKLRMLIRVVLQAVLDTGFLAIIIFLYLFIAASIGHQLFGGKIRQSIYEEEQPRPTFDTFYWSLLTVFQILTRDDWMSPMWHAMSGTSPAASLYFVVLVLVGDFVLLNLFLAILINCFDENWGQEDDASDESYAVEDATMEQDLAGIVDNDDSRATLKTRVNSRVSLGASLDHNMCRSVRRESFQSVRRSRVLAPSQLGGAAAALAARGVHRKEVETNGGRSLFLFGPRNAVRLWCTWFVSHDYFEKAMLCLIAASSVLLALDGTAYEADETDHPANIVDGCFTVIFSIEVAMKCIAMGVFLGEGAYLRDAWNVLDAVVVAISIFTLVFANFKVVKVFRTLRALRPLRVVNRFRGLKIVVRSLLRSLPGVANVGLVVFFIFFVFSTLGVQLFRGKMNYCSDASVVYRADCVGIDPATYEVNANATWEERRWLVYPQNFDNIFTSLLTLFEVSTLELWSSIMYRTIDGVGPDHGPVRNHRPLAGVYYMLFITIGSFFVYNLFVGVVIFTYNNEKKNVEGAALISQDQQQWLDMQTFMLTFRPEPMMPEEKHGLRKYSCALANHPQFHNLVLVMIMVNVLAMACEGEGNGEAMTNALGWIDFACSCFFMLEAMIKVHAWSRSYFRNRWNKFDCLLALIAAADIVVAHVAGSQGGWVRSVKLFRILRLIRLLKSSRGLRLLLETLFYSLPYISNIFLFLGLLFFIYATLGRSLFRGVKRGEYLNYHNNFDNFPAALQVLFRCCTGEDWNGVMHDLMVTEPDCTTGEDCGPGTWIPPLYFITFLLIAAQVMLNLFVAIILDNFATTIEIEKSKVGMKDLYSFIGCWSLYDPTAGLIIPTSALPELLVELGPPLGLRRASDNRIELLHLLDKLCIPEHCGKIHFIEVFVPLTRYSLDVRLDEAQVRQQEDDWKDIFPDLKSLPTHYYRKKRVDVTQFFAAVYIASSFKRAMCVRRYAQLRDAKRLRAVHWRRARTQVTVGTQTDDPHKALLRMHFAARESTATSTAVPVLDLTASFNLLNASFGPSDAGGEPRALNASLAVPLLSSGWSAGSKGSGELGDSPADPPHNNAQVLGRLRRPSAQSDRRLDG